MNKQYNSMMVLGLVGMVLLTAAAGSFGTVGNVTNLYACAGGTNGSYWPMGAVVANGSSLYGMAQLGGVSNFGVIYTVTTGGTGYTNLFSFRGFNGRYPVGHLLLNGSVLYGMTVRGGSNDNGVIFQVNTDGSGYTVLYQFATNTQSGAAPWGSLALNGTNFYGMTYYGGVSNLGVVFRINTNGTGYTNLHQFIGYVGDGKHPKGDVLIDGGKLYGMTSQGGTNDSGVVFTMAMDGSGYQDLYEFTPQAFPAGSLIKDGNFLYGMAMGGGNGAGLVFSIATNGGTLNVLKSLGGVVDIGREPMGTLVKHDTKLYGMTRYGGTNNAGLVFSLGGVYSNQYEWAAGIGEPLSEPVFAGNGLYGTTLRGGGNANKGTVFELDVDTNDTAVAWCAMTWVENGQLATVTAGDYSSDRIWVDENTSAGFPDQAYVGYGKTQNADDGTWTWVPLTSYGNMGANYEFTGTLGRASAGNYYIAAKFVKGSHVYYTQAGLGAWGDWNTALYATNRWTVNALKAPSNCTATAASSSQINVAWNNDTLHWVSIFRKTVNSFVRPVDGGTYSVGTSYPDQGQYIYHGGGASFSDTGLTANTTYYYAFYSENYGYYSTGTVASATTLTAGNGPVKLGSAAPAGGGTSTAPAGTGTSTKPLTASTVTEKVLFADNFNDGKADRWVADAQTSVDWYVTPAGQLRAEGKETNAYSYCMVRDLDIANRNLQIEYDVQFGPGATYAGFVYRGRVLYVNPTLCGWVDRNSAYTTADVLTNNVVHHVVVNIRPGTPYVTTDLNVDGQKVLANEPIEGDTWSSGSLGLLSAHGLGVVDWDNVQVKEIQPLQK